MSKIKEIKGKVVSYCSIPKKLIPSWLEEYPSNCYVEVHVSDEDIDELSKWLMKEYPRIEEETFYIEMNY